MKITIPSSVTKKSTTPDDFDTSTDKNYIQDVSGDEEDLTPLVLPDVFVVVINNENDSDKASTLTLTKTLKKDGANIENDSNQARTVESELFVEEVSVILSQLQFFMTQLNIQQERRLKQEQNY